MVTREPGGSPGAEAIRELLVHGPVDRWSPTTETLLLYAARNDHIERVIEPALEGGAWVVCDRFLDSTRAYQGAAGHAADELIAALETEVVGGLMPDLTLILDLAPLDGLARAGGRGGAERFEAMGWSSTSACATPSSRSPRPNPSAARCWKRQVTSTMSRRGSGRGERAAGGAPRWLTPTRAHPREVFQYEHGEAVEGAFAEALERGRLHHAWLLCGPEGVGKATFAYRAARRLLGAAADPAQGPLGSLPGDPVSRQVAVRSHPDLMVLERVGRTASRARSSRSTRPAGCRNSSPRPLPAPRSGGDHDAVDDMNANAANALLKRLLRSRRRVASCSSSPTRRAACPPSARCRRLRFEPWPRPTSPPSCAAART